MEERIMLEEQIKIAMSISNRKQRRKYCRENNIDSLALPKISKKMAEEHRKDIKVMADMQYSIYASKRKVHQDKEKLKKQEIS